MECQYHKNCGGHCETPEEIEQNLCADCLQAEREADAEAEAHRELVGLVRELLDTELGGIACIGSNAPVEDILGRLQEAVGA